MTISDVEFEYQRHGTLEDLAIWKMKLECGSRFANILALELGAVYEVAQSMNLSERDTQRLCRIATEPLLLQVICPEWEEKK